MSFEFKNYYMKSFIHELHPNPFIREFTPLASANEFMNEINLAREVTIDCSMETSKTLSISISYKQYRQGINMKVEGFKLLKRTKSNMWSNNIYESYHFKINQTQGMKELINYVESILIQYIDIDGYNPFTVKWLKTSALYNVGLNTNLFYKEVQPIV